MILDGKKISSDILNEIKKKLLKINKTLTLAIIEVGKSDENEIYIKQKIKMCNEVGYNYEIYKYDLNTDENIIIKKIKELNENNKITAILLQLPIKHLNEDKIRNSINPHKDVDCLTDINRAKLFYDNNSIKPCTVSGIIELFNRYNIDVNGKNVTILGRSNLIGKPLSLVLTNMNGTVTLCHSKTNNIKKHIKNADILLTAIGIPNYISRRDIKQNCILVDVSINKANGIICGDVNYKKVKNKVSFITPVPGGVGPMTIAMLAKNIYTLYENENIN